jgi:catecholate siderophore receptor
MAQGEGHRDAPVLRGNVTTADFFVDGVRDDLQYLRDLYNIERVDVVQGPAALTFGRGTGGGAINRVTKAADGQRVRTLDLVRDRFGQSRLAGDLGTSVNDALAVRLNVVTEESATFRDAMAITRSGIAPALRLRLASGTQFDLAAEHFRDARTVDRGVPSLDGRPWRGAPGTYFGNPEQSRSAVDVATARGTLTRLVGTRLLWRTTVVYGEYGKQYDNVFAGGAVSPAAGTLPIAAYRSATDRTNALAQSDLLWQGRLGAQQHAALVGVEVGRQRGGNLRVNAPGGIASLLDRGRSFAADFTGSAAIDNAVDLRFLALLAQDQMQLTSRLSAVAGVRAERVALRLDDHRAGGVPVERTDVLITPRLGLVWTVRPHLSLYGGWTTAALPQAGEQFAALDVSRATLAPERFTNTEVGARWEPTRDVLISTALYRLDRTNTTAPGAVPGLLVLTGAQRAEGLEVAVQGAVRPRWRMIGALAVQDARLTASTTAAPAGRRAPLVPRFSASMWHRVSVTPRLAVALGLVRQATQMASISNAVVLPAFTRADASLSLAASEALTLQVHAENVTGVRYWPTAHNDHNISPGAPPLARLSLRLRF